MKKLVLIYFVSFCSFLNGKNFIQVGIGESTIKNNFNINTDDKIDTYIKESSSLTQLKIAIKFRYQYQNIAIFMQQRALNIAYVNKGLETGVQLPLTKKENVYKNPFQLNTTRETTNRSQKGIYIKKMFKYKDIKTAAKFQYLKVDIQNDESIYSLQRDANMYKISINNKYNSYLFNLLYNINNAKGGASSYKEFGGAIGYNRFIDDAIKIKLLLTYTSKSYDERNIILNKLISSNKINSLISITKNNFYKKNQYLNLVYKYTKEDANHIFYNNDMQSIIVSIGYIF